MGCESLHHQWACVTRKKLDDRSHCGYFMGYAATTGVIIYWKTDQFDEYNYCIFTEDKHALGYLPLKQYPESNVHDSDLLNLIPCELDFTSTPVRYTKTVTYQIELPPYVNKVGFNLLDDEDFKIPYITDKIKNSPAGHQTHNKG